MDAPQSEQVEHDGKEHHHEAGQKEIMIVHEGEATVPVRVRALQTLLLDVPDITEENKKKMGFI